MYTADKKDWNGSVVFAMIQTLSRVKNNSKEDKKQLVPAIPHFDCVLIDEAHHSVAGSYLELITKIKKINPKVKIIGVTATPNRGDKKGLLTVFRSVAYHITINQLVAEGYLVPVKSFGIDIDGLKNKLNEIAKKRLSEEALNEEAAELLNTEVINTEVFRHWKEKAGDRKTIIFCSTIEHSKSICKTFNDFRIKAAHVDGNTHKLKREAILNNFDKGHIQVLCNVNLLTEGFDSQPVSCIILLRISSYQSTLIQMVGRALRIVDPKIYPDVVKKDAIVLDFGVTTQKHTLDFRVELKNGKGEAPKKNCKKCESEIPLSCLICPLCGADLSGEGGSKEKVVVTHVELQETHIMGKSPFHWVSLYNSKRIMVASGFNAFSVVVSKDGENWHAIGKHKDKEMQSLAISTKAVALSAADDFLRANELGQTAHKTQKWTTQSATPKQIEALKRVGITVDVDLLCYTKITKIEAAGYLNFKWNQRNIENIIKVGQK